MDRKHFVTIGLSQYQLDFTDEKPSNADFKVALKQKRIIVCRSSPASAVEQAVFAARRHEMPVFRFPVMDRRPQPLRAGLAFLS